MPKNQDDWLQVRRCNFLDRPEAASIQDLWDTTYRTTFVGGIKQRPQKYSYYKSPYRQQSKHSIISKAQAEKEQRLATLQQASIISEPFVVGLTNLCAICAARNRDALFKSQPQWCLQKPTPGVQWCLECGQELLPKHKQLNEELALYSGDASDLDCSICDPKMVNRQRVYSKDMPIVSRPYLPGDITEPSFIQLQARDWKGIPYPFADPRFDPFLPVGLDGSIAPSTINPFTYCQRRRTFPQFNRCPNLPVPDDALPVVEPLGFSTMVSKLYDRRWARRRFPKPPGAFLTSLW